MKLRTILASGLLAVLAGCGAPRGEPEVENDIKKTIQGETYWQPISDDKASQIRGSPVKYDNGNLNKIKRDALKNSERSVKYGK